MTAIRKLSGKFTEAEIDDEIVLMLVDTGETFAMSGTAAAAWRLIDGNRDRSELIAELAREFSAAPAGIAEEIDEFVTRLRHTGLVEN